MRPIQFLTALSSLLLLAFFDQASSKDEKSPTVQTATSSAPVEDLLADRSLGNWEHLLVDKSLGKADVWSVDDDGVLICKGKPLG